MTLILARTAKPFSFYIYPDALFDINTKIGAFDKIQKNQFDRFHASQAPFVSGVKRHVSEKNN